MWHHHGAGVVDDDHHYHGVGYHHHHHHGVGDDHHLGVGVGDDHHGVGVGDDDHLGDFHSCVSVWSNGAGHGFSTSSSPTSAVATTPNSQGQ